MENIYPATVADLNRIEWYNEPVLTTAQLDEKYETTITNIKTNFNRNADRFIEGKHFFKLEGYALKQFKDMVTESNDLFKPNQQP